MLHNIVRGILGGDIMATHIKLVDDKNSFPAIKPGHRLNDQERRQFQHEFKIYMEKYFKDKLGKGVDKTNRHLGRYAGYPG